MDVKGDSVLCTYRHPLSLLATFFLVTLPVSGAPMQDAPARPQAPIPPVEYTVSLERPQTQMVEISMHLRRLDPEQSTLDVHLPTWRPGRYIISDPAGTVRNVRAFNNVGEPLDIEKMAKSTWQVQLDAGREARIVYDIYANSLGDRTRHVDDTHAFLSGESVFMYADDFRDHGIRVRIEAPEGWTVASGLNSLPQDQFTLIAPNYDVLVDSPIEVGVHDMLRFNVDGKPHEIVIWGSDEYDADQLIENFSAIVKEQAAIFGDMPYERYVFMIHAGRGAGGGTEHLNSTIMQTSAGTLEGSKDNNSSYKRFLGLVSHEFFHTWNVKQLRPAGIHPYDYKRENYTRLLWVAEGTTSYYDDLTLARAGINSPNSYLDNMGEAIDRLRNRPGRFVQSLEDSSFDAWIKFNRHTPDDYNSTVSFYSKGALASWLLDLEIRKATENDVTLDTVMKEMYERFPLSGGGFTPTDLQKTIEELAGHSFEDFFNRFIRGTEELGFESALHVVGLELYLKPNHAAREDADENDALRNGDGDGGDGGGGDDGEADADAENTDNNAEAEADEIEDEDEVEEELPMKPYLGVSVRGNTVRGVRSDGPAYEVGIMPGDEIVAIDERKFSGSIESELEEYAPGDLVRVTIFRHEEMRAFTIALTGKPDAEWTIRRVKEPTDAQVAAYESWLKHDWPGRDEDADESDDDAARDGEGDS